MFLEESEDAQDGLVDTDETAPFLFTQDSKGKNIVEAERIRLERKYNGPVEVFIINSGDSSEVG